MAVYILTESGRYQTNVDASSVHDAVRKAIAFFEQPYWRGPKPTAESVYEVSEAYEPHRRWTVRAKDLG